MKASRSGALRRDSDDHRSRQSYTVPASQNESQQSLQMGHSAVASDGALTVGGERSLAGSLRADMSLPGRGNTAVRQAALQNMQRTYGNRAVQRYLQRTATPAGSPVLPARSLQRCGAETHAGCSCADDPLRTGVLESTDTTPDVQRQSARTAVPVQRDEPVLVGPIIVGENPKKRAAAQKIADDAKKRLPEIGRGFLRDWYSAANSALAVLPEPQEPEPKAYWYVALAGNLAWAATSLFPEAKLAVKLVSFAGAAVGSGVVEKLEKEGSSMPSGRQMIGDQLAQGRDAAEKHLLSVVIDVAADCAIEKVTNTDMQDKRLWAAMFPGIPYDKRSQIIFEENLAKIGKGLQSFVRQYQAWKQEIAACVERMQDKDPFGTASDDDGGLAQNGPKRGGKRTTAVQAKAMPGTTRAVQRFIIFVPHMPTSVDKQVAVCRNIYHFNPVIDF